MGPDEFYVSLGQLYHELRLSQKQERNFQNLLKKKDEEISLLKQKLNALQELKGDVGQRQSDK